MAVRYIYNGQKYHSLYLLRQAIWEKEHILYGSPKTQEEFEADSLLAGKVVFEEYDPWAELDDQSKAARLRAQRDEKLMESDFYMQPDYPSDPEALEAVKQYRQALRDITKQETFPNSVTWPEKPIVLLKEPEKTMALSA